MRWDWGKLQIVTAGVILLIVFYAIVLRGRDELEVAGETYELGPEGAIGGLCRCDPSATGPLWNRTLDFDALKFSNETGSPTGEYLVPNFVHFIHFGGKPLRYAHMICVLAAYKNQRPERLYLHYDNGTTFTGKYWEVLSGSPGLRDVLRLNRVEAPDEIFGQKLSHGWRFFHGGDIMRIKTLMQFGGIFVDNDCYVVRSLDDKRRFEVALNWDEGQFLGSQVIVAHRDARFLRRWLDCYREYHPDRWYYNAGERPTVEVLYKEPHLIHRVKVVFGADTKFIKKVFNERWPRAEWGLFYVVHLLLGHQYLLKNVTPAATYPVEFDEANVANYPVTFRDMAYDVYDAAAVDWPKAYKG